MDLIVVAKEPAAGRVKTRLTPPCTPQEAAALAEASLADTLAAGLASGVQRLVLSLDGAPGRWCPSEVEVVDQGHGSLPERLETVWSTVARPTLQIGMDTPQLTGARLDEAGRLLSRPDVDAVLGLALDGGWWGLGLRRSVPGCFRGIPVSRSDTGARQLARLRDLGLRTALLPPLRDVDRWADAVAVGLEIPGSAFERSVQRVTARMSLAVADEPVRCWSVARRGSAA